MPGLDALLALLAGLASSVIPLVNAEAYAVLRGQGGLWASIVLVLFLALGQTAGKAGLLELARRGSERIRRHRPSPAPDDAPSRLRPLRRLARVGSSSPALFASAALGLPPLAATAVAAGTTGVSRRRFVLLCLTGRSLRFGVVVATAQAVPLPWA